MKKSMTATAHDISKSHKDTEPAENNGRIIRLSLNIAKGRFALGLNALKLLLYIINDYNNVIMTDDTDNFYRVRTLAVDGIDFGVKNTYEAIDDATNELMSAFITLRLDGQKKFTKVQWFRKITYANGRITYQFDSLLDRELLRLGEQDGNHYVGISPFLVSQFYNSLAMRLYLYAEQCIVCHTDNFEIDPYEMADTFFLKPSYYPKIKGHEGGVKDAISNQKKQIEKALVNINEVTDINLSLINHPNKKGKVHKWEFLIDTGEKTEDTIHEYTATDSLGLYPVIVTAEEIEKLKKDFPNDWENRINELATWQEMKGYTVKNPLFSIRKFAMSGKY